MSGNSHTRRKARRAKLLAACRADGRFASLADFAENERLVAALRGEAEPRRYALKSLRFTGSFADVGLAAAATSAEERTKKIYASLQVPAEQMKGTSNVSIGSVSPKR